MRLTESIPIIESNDDASNNHLSVSSCRRSPLPVPRPTKAGEVSFRNFAPHFPRDKTGSLRRRRSLPSRVSEPSYSLWFPPARFSSSQPSSPSSVLQSSKKRDIPCRDCHHMRQTNSTNLSRNKCSHDGLGPFFGILPESVIYSIVGYIDYFDRHPTLLLISHKMTSILTRPEFFLGMKHANLQNDRTFLHEERWRARVFAESNENSCPSNELLFLVGGKFPTRSGNHSRGIGFDNQRSNQPIGEERIGMHRRMPMQSNEHNGIMGYDPKRKRWLRFGGDPSKPFDFGNTRKNRTDAVNEDMNDIEAISNRSFCHFLHPLSPHGIIGARPLYVGHPHYCLIFFGGTHYQSGLPSNRVVSYSFLSAKWEIWPEMMRARYGEDFVLARVHGQDNSGFKTDENLYHKSDLIVLIDCRLELCGCSLCSIPLSAIEKDFDAQADEIDSLNNDFDALMSDDNCSKILKKDKRGNFNSWGRCEVFDLISRKWERRKSRAPSCPPGDGGIAVLGGRYIYLPGTCPPPPSSCWRHHRENTIVKGDQSHAVPQLCQSESNPQSETPSLSSSSTAEACNHYNEDIRGTNDNNDYSLTSSMEIKEELDNGENIPSSLNEVLRSLHHRPGLVYDAWLDQWSTLPARPYVTTASPTTFAFQNRVLVLGGYRSSSEHALSCHRHREEDSMLDYEDHLDYAWWYTPSFLLPRGQSDSCGDCLDKNKGKLAGMLQEGGQWTFGGGTTIFGHRQAWAHSSDMAVAVAAAAALQRSSNDIDQSRGNGRMPERDFNQNDIEHSGIHDSLLNSFPTSHFPGGAPVPVRGATATYYQGRFTMLGGLSTFSRTFYDSERKTIWQFFPEYREWRRASAELPVPALLDGYAFSLHV